MGTNLALDEIERWEKERKERHKRQDRVLEDNEEKLWDEDNEDRGSERTEETEGEG